MALKKYKLLYEFRKKHNLTQNEMSLLLEIPFRTYQNWENSVNKPHNKTHEWLKDKLLSKTFLKKVRALHEL